MKKVRGIWITNVASPVLDSHENIKNAIKLLAQTGFNAVFPVVWWGGYTLFKSKVLVEYFPEKFEREEFKYENGYFGIDPRYKKGRDPVTDTIKDRDPLQEIINEAKRNYIKVIPWFEFGFGSSDIDSAENKENDYILKKYPDFAAKNIHSNPLYRPEKDYFRWMNAFNPDTQDFIKALIEEVCLKYDIDGIQGDERLPAFPAEGKTRFQILQSSKNVDKTQIKELFLDALLEEIKELNLSNRKRKLIAPITKPTKLPAEAELRQRASLVVEQNRKLTRLDPQQGLVLDLPEDEVEKALVYLWSSFRAKRLTEFLKQIRVVVDRINQTRRKDKQLLISMAPESYPDGFTEDLQDYEMWLDLVDMLHPQLYKFDEKQYEKALLDQDFGDYSATQRDKISIGISLRKPLGNGLYTEVTSDFLRQCMQINHQNQIRGAVFFFLADFLVNKLELSKNSLMRFFRTDISAYGLIQADDEGPDVVKIQLLLKEQGYYTDEVNGLFDQHTETAVKSFQQAKGLDERGVQGQTLVGPKTLHQLGFGSSEAESLIAFGQYLPWESQH